MKIAKLGERGSLLKGSDGRLKAVVTVNGKQFQKRVKTEEEGRQFVLSVELDRSNRDELSSKQLNDASNALHLLRKADVDVTFVDLARFYLDNAFIGVVSVKDAAQEYLEKCKARVTEGTLRNYKRFIGSLVEKLGDKKVASISRKDMIDYLGDYEQNPPNWMNAQRALSKFFVECEKYGYCSHNPCHLLDAPRNVKAPDRKYLSVEDAAKLIHYAESTENRSIIMFLVLGMFGGLRPSEALRMDAKHINMKSGYIHIGSDITKTHAFKERTFQIEPTLMAWLKAYYEPETKPVQCKSIKTFDYVISQTFKNAGVKRTGDCLRHTFGTYRFALTGNSAETASIMGHSEDVGNKFYRGRAPKDDAMKFFKIMPKEKVETDLDAL